jgi:hypothetical protein
VYTHQRRLEILADALRVRPSEVVSTLRRKNLHYVDARGVTLIDDAWSDTELVDGAFKVFIDGPLRVDGPVAAITRRK